jgi:hypothetical protein
MLGQTKCVKCENTNPSNPFTIDPEAPDATEQMANHFLEVHGVDVNKFKRKDKSELHY